ncbi:hypothetical protein DOY81_012977 [Sarcophaga bullata]|nr:hypothetical protein DOY81_012977 [Sarcophaga bullata]
MLKTIKLKLPPGLTFIGFIPNDAVQNEYFTGNSDEKFNKPKIVVLIPNEIKDDAPASLNMYELAYHNQYNCL